MPGLGRVGDAAQVEHEGEKSDAKAGSPDVFINGRAVLRVGDGGSTDAAGQPSWQGKAGSQTLFVNGLPALQEGDETEHTAGAKGALVEASPDVTAGKSTGSKAEVPHDQSVAVSARDALGRKLHDLSVKVFCPHRDHPDLTGVDGGATVSGLCSSAAVSVHKTLQAGTWDDDAVPRAGHFVQTKTSSPSGGVSPSGGAGLTGGAEAPPDDAPGTTVVAPAPASTPTPDPGVHVTRPNGGTTVVVPTVHNWVELVYRAFGHKVLVGPNQLTLLGVREASLGPHNPSAKPKSAEDLEKLVSSGELGQVDFIREKKTPTYNDLLFVVWADKSPSHKQHVEVYECTIDASPSTNGHLHLPALKEGQLLHGTPGSFHPKHYPGKDIALHLFSGAKEPEPKPAPTGAAQVIATAHKEIGTTEWPPESNHQKYGAWYGDDGVYWCAQFVSWVFAHSGMPQIHYEGCSAGASEFMNGAWGTWVGGPDAKAEPGDIVFYHFKGSTSSWDHTGIVVRDNGSSITTIEGNTSPDEGGSQDNGGGVYLKTREKSLTLYGLRAIAGYGRPRFAKVEPAPPESVIRWGGEKDTVVLKNALASTVLHHHYFKPDGHGHQEIDPKAERYAHFRSLFTKAENRAHIPYLITSAHYLNPYTEWVKAIAKQPGTIPAPASVIRQTALHSPEGHKGKYVPSFFTKKYADKVLEQCHSMSDRKTAHAIKSELEAALFELSI